MPAGVIQGQKFDLALTRFTQRAAHIRDFDDFPIPFRAVASDIVTGKAVVLGSGNLASSIRASMSVPAVFAPVEIDGHRLVDGGIANNLPIDVVRDMGADIVIAVDISTPLLTDEQVDSVLAITVQLTGILTRTNAEIQIGTLTDDDLLLVPDLGEITSPDFDRAAEAVPTGRAAAQASLEALQRYSLDAQSYAQYRASLSHIDDKTPVLDFIRLANESHIKDSQLAFRVHNSKVGEPFSVEAAEADVGRIYGLELFENVGYDLVEDGDQTGLEFHIRERSWGPAYLQVGAAYESNNDEDNIFNLAVSTLHTGLNASRGELRLGVQIGEEPGFLADYHQPFGDQGMWFANVKTGYSSRAGTVFRDDDAVADFDLNEAFIEGSVGREFGTWGEVRAGLRYADGDTEQRVGDRSAFPGVTYQSGEFFTRFYVDEFDSYFFPSKGYSATAEWRTSRDGLGADDDFEQIDLVGTVVKSWGKHTLLGSLAYQSTISGEAPIQSRFFAGGFLRLSGYNTNELSGQHFTRAAAIYYRRLGHKKFLPLYVGASLEAGNVFENRDDISLGDSIYAGSVWLGADTPVGPVYAIYGNAEGGNDAFYIFLGRAF